MRRLSAVILLLLSSAALADDFAGQASIIDGDTMEIHGTRIRLWGIDAPESTQLCRGEDSLQYRCGAQAANDLYAFIGRRPVNCVPVSLDPMGERSPPVQSAVLISANGLCATALRWIGLNTRRADMTELSVTPSAPAGESGRAAMSSRGSIVLASARMENHRPVRMMQMPILNQHSRRIA
jgi:hypothetical protein